MPTPHEKLARSLESLRTLQQKGQRVFQSKNFGRTDRERLQKNGFLKEVTKGWLISSDPHFSASDSTPWYASFWEFCAAYCQANFENQWHLSPEQSLLLHAESTSIPKQVIIHTIKGHNNLLSLLFGTSLYVLKSNSPVPQKSIQTQHGLNIFRIPAALAKVPAAFFQRHPLEAQMILCQISDASELLRILLDGGHSTIAGRLVGGFQHVGALEVADEILQAMTTAGYTIRISNPFQNDFNVPGGLSEASPIVTRIQTLWATHRATILQRFAHSPHSTPLSQEAFEQIEDHYQNDAYHSLSIEGYDVSLTLLERVRTGKWDSYKNEADHERKNALAARGYWQAFQKIKQDLESISIGASPGKQVQKCHRSWYRELFEPCVVAGLIPASALAGYRNHPVFLKGSRHVPPRWEIVQEAMNAYWGVLCKEPEPIVQAILGHWLFGYIHPYPDGNGRIARFLMNTFLVSGGYHWTIIPAYERTTYLEALEQASVHHNLEPFVDFLSQTYQNPPLTKEP